MKFRKFSRNLLFPVMGLALLVLAAPAAAQPPAALMQQQAGAIQVTPAMSGSLGQFTFKVPLDIKNLYPQVDGIGVSCGVRDSAASYTYNSHTTVAPANGNVQKTVTLYVNVTGQPDQHGQTHPNITNADMTEWYCNFTLKFNGTNVLPSESSSADPSRRVEPGTTIKRSASGPIPW